MSDSLAMMALATATVDVQSGAKSRRSVLVFTGSATCGSGDGDKVHLLVDGHHPFLTKFAGHIRAGFRIPDTAMPPSGRLYGCEFPDIPEGLARIKVFCSNGLERFYCVTIGDGYSVPWHASLRYRGWEAYWCGR